MTTIESNYLPFFQHTGVCMRQLCLESTSYRQINTEIITIVHHKLPNHPQASSSSTYIEYDRKSSD